MSTNDRFAAGSVPPPIEPNITRQGISTTLRLRDTTVHVQRISSQVRITPQARRYAIGELARRAGVPSEVLQQWKIRVEADRTVVDVLPDGHSQLIFPHASPELLHELSAGRIRTVRRGWMPLPKNPCAETIPDFLIPFANGANVDSKPLFIVRHEGQVECTVDLPLSILLNLSRWEETLSAEHDEHGRFRAEHSAAVRGRFVQRPVVDEYGFAFEQALRCLLPNWVPREKKLRVKISHDADHIGIPFRWKDALRHTIHHRNPRNSARDFLGYLARTEPSDLRAIREILDLSLERKLDSAVYWKASPPGPQDSGYDPRHPKVRKILDWMNEREVESGVHPGYETFHSPEKLRREVQILREALGDGPLGGRQHYLRWSPDTWLHWETSGLAYDSTLCFAECVGFRAGTCIPYRPWLFSLNREADLLEIPLLVMDRTLLAYMKLNLEDGISTVQDCVNRCRTVGGVFTIVWHNNTFLDPVYRALYLRLLPLLEAGARYDWRRDLNSLSADRS